MSIITLSEALLQKLSPKDGLIIRDRVLCGLCIKIGRRNRTFLIATSVGGKQLRMTLGRWPLISVEEARALALPILKNCRNGQMPLKRLPPTLPTLSAAVVRYTETKGLKASSLKRYLSIIRTHFHEWQDCSVTLLKTPAFAEHCHAFSQTRGAAIVEVGRGLISALIKYLNAVHRLDIESPFDRLAAAGLMPDRAKPRARKLQEADLPQWRKAVDSIPEKQRDCLLLIAYTGLRRNECSEMIRSQVDLVRGVIAVPETKTGRPHSLPITARMRDILDRRCTDLGADDLLFAGVAADHLSNMAERAGAPKFMLHDLRKLLATTGEKLGFSAAIMRRILNHTAKRSDTLYRHYISLNEADISDPLVAIQERLDSIMQRNSDQP
ncbi:MAG: integrase family protein [Gammaproteobacteria bacterium]|nr:integrase family protein [Gammaproteobacteria bacterium]